MGEEKSTIRFINTDDFRGKAMTNKAEGEEKKSKGGFFDERKIK